MYNPANDYYFQNAQQIMARQPYPQQNYGQQMLPFPPQPPQTPQINSRFVTNIEEAKAAMIDPLSYNLFLDTQSGKIYLKKLGNNGQSEFLCYLVEETQTADPIKEINARLINIENSLNLNNLEQAAKEMLGMQKLDNSQKVYISLPKKDYIEPAIEDVVKAEERSIWQKIINSLKK